MNTQLWFSRLAIVCCLMASLTATGCGFLGSRYAVNEPPPATAERIVSTAYQQVGKSRYRLGGASPQKGFDCSGLIWWAYKQNGVNIPRITVEQARAGVRIPSSKARPGDIVVFRTGSSPRGLHTGIYAGDNAFIHSPSRGQKVKMDSLDLPHWRKTLISVRRVL